MKRNDSGDGRKAKRRRLWFWLPVLALTAGVLAGAGWALRAHSRAAAARDEARAAAERPAPAVVCLGIADFEAGVLSLHPTVPGRVAEVPAVENRAVREGSALLRLDDEAARARVGEAEAALEASEAQLAEARKAPRQHQLQLDQQKAAVAARGHDLAAARLVAAHKDGLARREVMSRQEADAAAEQVKKLEAALDADQARLDALALRDPAQDVRRAEADVRAKREAVDLARHALREHTVRAPSDGTVLRVQTNPGETLGPQPRRPALLFAPDKTLVVRAEVDQEAVGLVAVGQRAEVEDDAVAAGPARTGRVARVAQWFAQRRTILPDAPTLLDVRTLECVIHLDPGQPPLRLGQRVRVKLIQE